MDRAKGTRLEHAEIGVDPPKFSFSFEHFPTAHDDFRELLRGQLSTVFDLVNGELLPAARRELATSATASAKRPPSRASATPPSRKAATTTRSTTTSRRFPIHREIGAQHGEAATLLGYGSALASAGSARAAQVLEDAARIYDLLGRADMAQTARDRLVELPSSTA